MVECELCGQKIVGKTFKVAVEGVTLTVCQTCYMKFLSRKPLKHVTVFPYITRKPLRAVQTRTPTYQRKPSATRKIRSSLEYEYEVVEDYAERIRKARENLGWSSEVLAQKVREKESVIRRIESGKLKPTLELARKLEKILKISLLEPTVLEYTVRGRFKEDLTLGDIVVIRKKKGG